MNITISENIKKLRNKKGITQERLAEYLKVTPQAISRWESASGFPAIEYLPDIAAFFGITVDELLGVKLTEREEKRREMYALIDHIEECGYNITAIDLLRKARADFPDDERIALALAKALASTRFEEEQDKALLEEAEKLLRNLIRHAEEPDFRFRCIKELAVIYKEAWQDERGYREVLGMLPSLDSCRELFILDYYEGAEQDPEEMREAILALARRMIYILRDYIAYTLPNEPEHWETKAAYFGWMIGVCEKLGKIIEGQENKGLLSNIAVLYRYSATYYVAMGKKKETLQCLEKMCDCVEKLCDDEEDAEHNRAWYFLRYLPQERYDPVREEKRFKKVEKRLAELAK
ncbi:MAG: helix-turn-helix transcriptional regulator [Lachnospiraceae bacterium]|nr:helix-turn-helix transcriptional regulator [Lachnospiraceae bacterium]